MVIEHIFHIISYSQSSVNYFNFTIKKISRLPKPNMNRSQSKAKDESEGLKTKASIQKSFHFVLQNENDHVILN